MKYVALVAICAFTYISNAFLVPPAASKYRSHALLGKVDQDADTTSAATKYSGTGQVKVDMNQFNLPIDKIMEEWTANLIAEDDFRESGVVLGAKSFRDVMVDTVQIRFRRVPNSGMGILLQEIAGGREDGLGITIVSGLVEGGAADGCEILVGDSISKISVETASNKDEGDRQEIGAVATECLGYDATVEAIQGLPSVSTKDQIYCLTLKRLRRRPRVQLTIQYPPSQGEPEQTLQLFAGENLRRAMLSRGVKLNDPLARRFDNGGSGDCGAEGTCATCVVSVLKGGELLNAQGIQEQQMLKDNPRWRLGCRAIVGYGFQEGEMILRVNPRQWAD